MCCRDSELTDSLDDYTNRQLVEELIDRKSVADNLDRLLGAADLPSALVEPILAWLWTPVVDARKLAEYKARI